MTAPVPLAPRTCTRYAEWGQAGWIAGIGGGVRWEFVARVGDSISFSNTNLLL